MIDIDVNDKREQRKFGLTLAVAFAVLGGLRWWWKGETTGVLFAVAAAFLVAGVAARWALRPVFKGWLRLADMLNWVMTRVLLGLVFVAMIVPGRVIMVLAGHDPLKRRWLPDAPTYWEEPEEQPDDPKRYLEQY